MKQLREIRDRIIKQFESMNTRIARERETARETAHRIEANLEEWLLGSKKVVST